jgi:hypothetical protein
MKTDLFFLLVCRITHSIGSLFHHLMGEKHNILSAIYGGKVHNRERERVSNSSLAWQKGENGCLLLVVKLSVMMDEPWRSVFAHRFRLRHGAEGAGDGLEQRAGGFISRCFRGGARKNSCVLLQKQASS